MLDSRPQKHVGIRSKLVNKSSIACDYVEHFWKWSWLQQDQLLRRKWDLKLNQEFALLFARSKFINHLSCIQLRFRFCFNRYVICLVWLVTFGCRQKFASLHSNDDKIPRFILICLIRPCLKWESIGNGQDAHCARTPKSIFPISNVFSISFRLRIRNSKSLIRN